MTGYASSACPACGFLGGPGVTHACKPYHPDTPKLPSVYEAALEHRVAKLEAALREIATRPKVERNPDGDDQAAWTMALIAQEALGETPDAPKEDRHG